MTHTTIKQILDSLNTLQEQLMSLPDDMLLSIDPRDNDSLDKGVNFIKEFNRNMMQFTQSAARIAEQVKTHFGINPEEDELEQGNDSRSSRERITKELDKTQAYNLQDDFTYKRPYGFVLEDVAVKGIKTWKSMYLQILSAMKTINPILYSILTKEEKFISRRGNPLFSETGKELRVAEKMNDNFYAEVNLSANMIRRNMSEILTHFGVDPLVMKVYMREDRDAE